MAKGDEKKLAGLVLRRLKPAMRRFHGLGVSVDKKVKILSDLTCVMDDNEFKLVAGFTEVDVVVYRQIPFDKSNKLLLQYMKFVSDSRKDKKFLNIPFVILELKSGGITSDAIRARNEVARKIKGVFPFCSYIFLGQNTAKKQETVFRQGKSFDNFFIFQKKIRESDLQKVITSFIKPHLKNLKEMDLL